MKPYLKWAGSKAWLVPVVQDAWDAFGDHKPTIVEPFGGSAALSLGLEAERAVIRDANRWIISLHRAVALGEITQVRFIDSEVEYYARREAFNRNADKQWLTDIDHRAACEDFLYLLRFGFNGLCRFNRKGEFNVPWGGRGQQRIWEKDFSQYHGLTRNWHFTHCTLSEQSNAVAGSLLYLDPPYLGTFDAYAGKSFTAQDHQADLNLAAGHRGPVLLSLGWNDSDAAGLAWLGFDVYRVPRYRAISQKSASRGVIYELLAARSLPAPLNLPQEMQVHALPNLRVA